jgi:hypothetical protein
MNNAAVISAVNRALAHYRRRQAHTPTDHSAREIAQISMFAEYLHEMHTPSPPPSRAAAGSNLRPGHRSDSSINQEAGAKGSRPAQLNSKRGPG